MVSPNPKLGTCRRGHAEPFPGDQNHAGGRLRNSEKCDNYLEKRRYVANIDTKVVLIDGQLLSGLMIDFDVGVSVAASYVVKKIDSDYFDEG
jgi:restriction endonuclease Mrr